MQPTPNYGIYYTSLSIENLRCFGPEQTIGFSDGHGNWARWTILLGANGTGKTTVLQSLAAIAPTISKRFESGQIKVLPVVLFNRDIRSSFTGSHLNLKATISANKKSKEMSLKSAGPEDLNFSSSNEQTIFLIAYGATRISGRQDADVFSVSSSATLFSNKVELIDPERWLLQLDYASRDNEKFVAQLEAVQDALVRVLPDVDALHVRQPGYKETTASAMPRPGFIECETPYGPVPISKLSLGYQSMIAWLVDLVARMFVHYPNSDNPLAESAVVLIDEIDLHLHPSWQRQLLSFLTERFPRTQFIATAHSPLVVQAAASIDANLVLLKQVDGHVEVNQDLAAIKNWRVDQILTSDLFGLESSRGITAQKMFEERTMLLNKRSLNATEGGRLETLQAEISDLPAQESSQQQDTLDFLSRALDALETKIQD